MITLPCLCKAPLPYISKIGWEQSFHFYVLERASSWLLTSDFMILDDQDHTAPTTTALIISCWNALISYYINATHVYSVSLLIAHEFWL